MTERFQSKTPDDIPQSCKEATLLSCADEGSCGDSNQPVSGCGSGAGCGTGTGCGSGEKPSSISKKVESLGFNNDSSDNPLNTSTCLNFDLRKYSHLCD